jgi:hypothetical protein
MMTATQKSKAYLAMMTATQKASWQLLTGTQKSLLGNDDSHFGLSCLGCQTAV